MKRIKIKGVIIPNSYKDVYDFFGMDSTCPSEVERELLNEDEVEISINSGGGEIFAGSEIYSMLRSFKGKLEISIDGIAGSAASVIACAGHNRISPTGMMMIHNVSSQASGDYRDMEKEAAALKECNRAIASAYIEKTGKSEKELLKLMDEETWLSASKAIELGFVDEIIPVRAASINGLLSQEEVEKARTAIAEQKRISELKNKEVNNA